MTIKKIISIALVIGSGWIYCPAGFAASKSLSFTASCTIVPRIQLSSEAFGYKTQSNTYSHQDLYKAPTRPELSLGSKGLSAQASSNLGGNYFLKETRRTNGSTPTKIYSVTA